MYARINQKQCIHRCDDLIHQVQTDGTRSCEQSSLFDTDAGVGAGADADAYAGAGNDSGYYGTRVRRDDPKM